MSVDPIKAPFPWFGGKSRAADLIWPRFGNVPNYSEPFFGSGAVLLRRPHAPGNEIINDLDCYVANAWRAMKFAPEQVAEYADWPVNEADLHARHRWLHGRTEFRTRMEHEPDFYDPRIAGYWIWGLSCWIGDNFCRPKAQDSMPNVAGEKGVIRQLPDVIGTYNATAGHNGQPCGKVVIGAEKIARKLPCVAKGAKGVVREEPHPTGSQGVQRKIPHLTGSQGVQRQIPHLTGAKGGPGTAARQSDALLAWFSALSDRLRHTKVCCGGWERVVTKASTYGQGLTAVFLDPPYDAGESHDDVYGSLSRGVSAGVREWALANADNPMLRIALCGYEGEHTMPDDWECVSWKAAGGYGNQSDSNENAARERIWFSPNCLKPEAELFATIPVSAGLVH